MRLSFIVELLLVFLFLAFAAARVIDNKDVRVGRAKKPLKRQGPPNRYCACSANSCNCCRDFSLPVVPLKGPGCASLQYLKDDNMLVSMSFGDRVLTNTTVNSRKPKPICMNLPGGISQFCGKIYGISRQGEHFKACLGLELRALDDIEAALRVSCFKFGPKGVKVEAAPPVPTDDKEDSDEDYDLEDDDDDDDDDDDTFGLADDDDYSDEEGETAASNQDNEVESDDSADYTGFSVLGEDLFSGFGLFGDDDGEKKKKKKIKTAKPDTTTKRPLLFPNRPTIKPIIQLANKPAITIRPIVKITRRPVKKDQDSKPSAQVTVTVPPPARNSSVTPAVVTTVTTPAATPSVVKTTDVFGDAKQPTSTPAAMTSTTVKQTSTVADLSIPPVDVAKVEAVAAIAQQAVAAPMLVSTTTVKPTEKPSISEMLKANPVDDLSEEDLLDGMLGEVASIVSDDKPKPNKVKKDTNKTKKGDLASSSITSKPTKKPTDDVDPISFISSVVGVGGDDTDEDYDGDESSEKSEESEETSPDSDDDEGNIFDSVIGVFNGVTGNKGTKKPNKNAASEESEEKDDDILGALDDDTEGESEESEEQNDDDDDEEDSDEVEPVTLTTSTQVPDAKPEGNLVDSQEIASPEIEEVTDYESDEEEITTTATAATKNSEENKSEEEESNEKSAATIQKNETEADDAESTDIEIEGDIGLGADDEERQIKKIQQIVGESKRGRAPANWSVFLRPIKRFSPEPVLGSARGDRSSRVHRRMNLERIA